MREAVEDLKIGGFLGWAFATFFLLMVKVTAKIYLPIFSFSFSEVFIITGAFVAFGVVVASAAGFVLRRFF